MNDFFVDREIRSMTMMFFWFADKTSPPLEILHISEPGDPPPPPPPPRVASPPAALDPAPAGPGAAQTYVAEEECDSIESLGLEEQEDAALLKDEEKSKSENSLLIYFDGTDVQDTCV